MLKQEQFILPERVTVRDPWGNRYLIEGILGKGEFGAVYLVSEGEKPRALFALKEVINPNKVERERFAFEGEVLRRLRHRALPGVHRVFENDKLKRVYLLMDYIQGTNLEVLREEQVGKVFPLPLVRVLMTSIVDALVYLHTQDPPVVHRDIKPANIIVPVGGGAAVLADFGSAKEYVPGTATIMVGHRSPGYAALEQYRTGTTPATDVYGLGATLYVLLTGVAPLDAPSRLVKSLSTGIDPVRPADYLNPALPPAVARSLQRAMAIKVADRYQSVEDFWQDFVSEATQKLPRVDTAALPLLAAPGHPEGDRMAAIQREEPAASRARGGMTALRLCAVVLVLLAFGMVLLSYLTGPTLLLRCCVALLLLALAVLPYALCA